MNHSRDLVEAGDQRIAAPRTQADSDERLIGLWLRGRGENTAAAYRWEVERFLRFVRSPLRQVTLADVQGFADSLSELASASRARALAAVKSLSAFGHRFGYLQFDVARPLRLPPLRNRLAERILSEVETQRMLALEPDERNRVLLRLLYATGVRVSELTGLRWRDLQEREEGGQITVFGKGGKTRAILLPATIWREILALRADSAPDAPVFRSRVRGGPLSRVQVERIALAAARRAGIEGHVSPPCDPFVNGAYVPGGRASLIFTSVDDTLSAGGPTALGRVISTTDPSMLDKVPVELTVGGDGCARLQEAGNPRSFDLCPVTPGS